MAFQMLRRCKNLRPYPVRHAVSPRPLKLNGILLGGSGLAMAMYTQASSPVLCQSATTPQSPSPLDAIKKLFGFDSNSDIESEAVADEKNEGSGENDKDSQTSKEEGTSKETEGKVVVELDEEVVASLPVVPLSEVREADGMNGGRLLATYEGIVYDVTSFADHHPGGRELLRTAAGFDLAHFFNNYTVHGQSTKAANWLAPLAVGKLTPEETEIAKKETTPVKHVEKRMRMLGRARRKVLVVAMSLPFWMFFRSLIRAVGTFIHAGLAKQLANALPLGVTVPGITKGSERLDGNSKDENGEKPSVAVIGGGIAGCGSAWALSQSGFNVTLFEARQQVSGNARTFDWDFSKTSQGALDMVKSCVSVTAWPPLYYKNYTALLEQLKIETKRIPLSWFLYSKVPGAEGTLWAADPEVYPGSLRKVFEKDFDIYRRVERFAAHTTDLFCLSWLPWKKNDEVSMYTNHTGLGLFNPLNVVPLYSLFKAAGGSDLWWDVIFTPHYTASFLVDELRPFPAVFGPLIEAQIPLNPNKNNATKSVKKSTNGNAEENELDVHLTTCVTWKDAGVGIRSVFEKLVSQVKLKENLRVREVVVLSNGKKRVYDENDGYIDVDRVVFACPANAVGNILKKHGVLEEVIFSTPVYADDHHPSTGHMHAVMHSDNSVISEDVRDEVTKRASNYVEVTRMKDGSINIENQYNFGVQTVAHGVSDMPLDKKPVMLISHALGEGKTIDPSKIRGTGNHARAHPLYSGWNVAAQLSLRLVQGRDGVYYCSNWTTPGNCHDMSLLSGFIAAHAVGADYPFPGNKEAKKDFNRLRDLMGI